MHKNKIDIKKLKLKKKRKKKKRRWKVELGEKYLECIEGCG